MRPLTVLGDDEAFFSQLPSRFPGAELSAWTIDGFSEGDLGLPQDAPILWKDTSGSLALSLLSERPRQFRLDFGEVLSAVVSTDKKAVSIQALMPEVSTSTVEHFLFDQVAPRLIGEEGALVIHAAAAARDGMLIALVGESGVGKSTLSMKLQTEGWILLGDDALIARSRENVFYGEAVYGSLRLRPDSIEALLPCALKSKDVAHYSDKRNFNFLAQVVIDQPPLPISALFFLSSSWGEERVEMEPLTAAEACMSLVENGFCLDPTNIEQAKDRLTSAAGLSNAVPAYSLSYPRRFDFLPQVCEAIETQLKDIGHKRPHAWGPQAHQPSARQHRTAL